MRKAREKIGGAGPEERQARSERREVKPKEELSPEEKEKGAVAEVSEEAFNEEENKRVQEDLSSGFGFRRSRSRREKSPLREK